MITKLASVFTLFLASTAACQVVYAQTYQWKDSSGRTVISDTPPPASVKIRQSIGSNPPPAVSEKVPDKTAEGSKPPEAPKPADKDAEFKKRQQAARDKAEKQAREQAAEADRRENCERARRNLATLESSQPIATYDESGERKLMDNPQREQEIERARRFMADTCQ